MSKEELPEAVEEEVQKFLRRFAEEPKTQVLRLTREQQLWLGRAVHIFQAHEMQSRVNYKDKMFTEAMVRYVMGEIAPENRTVDESGD